MIYPLTRRIFHGTVNFVRFNPVKTWKTKEDFPDPALPFK